MQWDCFIQVRICMTLYELIAHHTTTSLVPVTPPQVYLTLSLRNLGFDTTQSNLLSIPSTVLGGIMLLVAGYMSEIVNSRVAATVILQIWALPLLIALYTFNSLTSQWAYFAVVSLIAGNPYVHPVQVAWVSSNSSSVRTRTVSASVYNMCVQAAAIIGVCSSVLSFPKHRLKFKRLNLRLTSIEMTIRSTFHNQHHCQ